MHVVHGSAGSAAIDEFLCRDDDAAAIDEFLSRDDDASSTRSIVLPHLRSKYKAVSEAASCTSSTGPPGLVCGHRRVSVSRRRRLVHPLNCAAAASAL
ncbi:hypothetical protein NHJ13734_004784 [Beauveria thailandica]